MAPVLKRLVARRSKFDRLKAYSTLHHLAIVVAGYMHFYASPPTVWSLSVMPAKLIRLLGRVSLALRLLQVNSFSLRMHVTTDNVPEPDTSDGICYTGIGIMSAGSITQEIR
ncbi:MAG: hypothetical protein ABI882_04995 [Acidobacteriota bacterium]